MKQSKIYKVKSDGFHIPCTPPTRIKSIRFPNDIVERIEKQISGRACTFSAFVVAAVKAALDDLQRRQ